MTKTWKRKILGVLLSLLVVVTGGFGVSLMNGDNASVAYAETKCTFENGFCTTHTSGCYEAATQEDGYFQITNGGQLFWFAQMVNEINATSFNGKLVNDINLENRAWTSIGSASNAYAGTFDGDGKTITGLNITATNSYQGLFGYVSGGTIKNFTIKGEIVVSGTDTVQVAYVGGVVGHATNNTITQDVTSYVNLTDAKMIADSTKNHGKQDRIGGVVGSSADSSIKNCDYYGEITMLCGDNCGGVVGVIEGSTSITYCNNYGNVTFTGDGHHISGVAGSLGKNTTITCCANYGDITSNGNDCLGGVVAYSYQYNKIENCANIGTITYTGSDNGFVGGILGYINQDSFLGVFNSFNYGAIISNGGTTYAGAIIGNYGKGTDGGNNYYLDASCKKSSGGNKTVTAMAMPASEFKNGAVAFLLNNEVTDGTQAWYQKIDLSSSDEGDDYPVFSGETVYFTRIGGCCDETYKYGYRNADLNDSDLSITHDFDSFEITETTTDDGYYKVYVTCTKCNKIVWEYEMTKAEMVYDGEWHEKGEFYTITDNGANHNAIREYQLDGAHIYCGMYLYYKAPNKQDYQFYTDVCDVGSYKFIMEVYRNAGSASEDSWSGLSGTGSLEYISYVKVVPDSIGVTFEDYDGTTLSETTIDSENSTYAAPTYTIPSNDYYTYTFKYWHCEQTGENYASDNLPTFETLGDAGYTNVTFTAVYDKEYKKGFELDGSIDSATDLSTSGIYTNGENVKIVETDKNGNVTGDVNVYANYAITTNNGVAALLLIPEYDKTKFAISAVSVNGESVYGSGATSNKTLLDSDGNPWSVTVTGDDVTADTFKILLEGLPASTATGDLFIQIVYTMAADNVVTGEYSFGFVTDYPEDTSKITHNNRSEAYGVSKDSEIASFSELRISVNEAKIVLVKRQNASIELVNNNVVYDSKEVNIVEDCYYKANGLEEQLKNELVYHYSAYDVELVNGDTWDWLQYIEIVAWYDKNGTKLEGAPIHVGQYKVGISAKQNDYFKAVEEKQYDFYITPYTIDVEVEKPDDKTYNADAQTWVNDEFTISYLDGKAAFEGDTGYTYTVSDNTKDTNYYENGSVVRNWAGDYTVTLTFTAGADYTFATANGDVATASDGATKTVTFDVKINKYKATVSAANKTSEYSDDVDASTLAIGNMQDLVGVVLKDMPNNGNVLKLVLTTTATNESKCGDYPILITATGSAANSYEFAFLDEMGDEKDTNGNNGTYTITQKVIALPTIDPLTYNGAEQFPEVTEAATINGKVVYAFSGDKQINVGDYTLTATLSSDQYKWKSETIAADELDATIDWSIVAATLEITIGEGWTSEYSESLQTIIGTVTGGALLGTDTIENIGVTYTINGEEDDNGFLPVGTYTVTGNNGGTNYIITFVDGKYTVTKKVLDDDELQTILASIIGATKEYTGSELTWVYNDESKDFTIVGELNGIAYSDIISITAVAAQDDDYTNANGKLDEDTWTYWDPETKLYYTASIAVKDTNTYMLYADENGDAVTEDSVNVEVFIKQAKNEWLRGGPRVNSDNIYDFDTDADAKFKGDNEVKVVLTDSEGKVVTYLDLVKGEKYKATFTVLETNNYTGLYQEINFEIEGYVSIALPTVYLDEENGTVVAPNSSVTITYDGNTHKFVVIPENEKQYTIYVSTKDNYASWKNANNLPTSSVSYYIAIELTENYQWDTGDRDARVYGLTIKQKTLTITATSYDVTFGDVIEKYEMTADGFVNGETYADYGVEDIGAYFTCEYVAGDQEKGKVGTYPIAYNDGNTVLESLHTLLSNYEVTVKNGEVVVSAYELDLSGLQGKLDEQDEQTWTEFVKGLTVEYNAKTHSISVLGLPDEIEATVTYENDTYPIDAGDYSITVSFAIKGELNGVTLNADNYAWDDPSATVTLTITKVHVKLTAYDQRVEWEGDPVYGAYTIEGEKKVEYIGSATDTSFIENELLVGNVIFDDEYSLSDGQDELVLKDILYVYYEFIEDSNGKAENYEIEKVYATLTIYRGTPTWAIELTTVDRAFNGYALWVGSETSYADYFAKVNVTNYNHNKGNGKLTYSFYTKDGDTYTEISAPANAGTYYVRAVYTNTIYKDLDSGYVAIVISKASVSVTATAEDRNYLQDLVYGYTSDTMNKFGGNEQSVTYQFSNDNGATWVSNPENKWFTVGDYQVKAIVNESTNYQGAESTATFTISKATLNGVTFSYDKDTATWAAITQTTDGEDINKYGDVTVTYKVGENTITDNKFTATKTGIFTLVASIEGNDNFIGSESTMKEVFSVMFFDNYNNHSKSPFPVYDFSDLAPTQYRFSGEYATQPDCCNADAAPITIDGYTFAKKWEITGVKTEFSFATPITENIMLDALWNINVYTVTWMNDNNELATEKYEYLEIPSYKGEEPVKDTTDEYAFTFAGWSLTIDGEKVELTEVTDDITYYAFYTKAGVTYAIVFKVSEDGGDYTTAYEKTAIAFGTTLTGVYNLADVTWFRGDVWYTDEARTQVITTMPVAKGGLTVYGAYVFDIGNGDVNADGQITTDDITIYREWVVGGYEMTVVEKGTEWTLVHSDGFDASGKYFLERVADVNADTSMDIRDITTIRMAIVEGYGYEIASGVKMAKVSGEAVRTIYIAPKVELNYEFTADEDVTLVEQNGKVITVDSTDPPKENVGNGGVYLPKTALDLLKINVSGIDTEYLASGAVPTVKVGLYKGEVSETNKYAGSLYINRTAVDDNGNFTIDFGSDYGVEDRTYIMTIDVTYYGITYLQSEFTVTFYKPLTYTFSESQQIGVSSVYEVEISEDGKTITIDKNSVKERYAVNAYKGLFNVNIDLGRNLGDGTTEENATVIMTLTTKKKMSEGVNIRYGRWGERDGVSGGWIYDDYTYETADDGGVSFGVDFAAVALTIDSGEYTLSITVSYGNFTWKTAEYTLVLENF